MKNIYDAEHAHIKAHKVISQSRSGLCVCEEEIARLNTIISSLVKQGQSIHQIYVSHEGELMCSEKTIYNYIDACLLDVRNIDLPKKVRFRKRYKMPEFKVDKGCRIGRNYEAFQSFMENNPDTVIVQMNSVIGAKGGKCLLTVHFVETSLMLAFLRESNTSQSVIDVYNGLDQRLGRRLFRELFPVILTDNGSEFSNPKAIEYGLEKYDNLRTQIYYCDAGCFRTRPIQEVVEEIRRLPSRFFVFWDDNLFADIDYAKNLFCAIAPHKREWAAQATLRDCKDEELLTLAKAAGCVYLFIGLESFSEASLSDAGKNINRVQDYKPLIDRIHRHGIMVQAGIVFGFDGDTKNVFDET